MSGDEIDAVLAGSGPGSSSAADVLLDLRTILMERGHPGQCVNCFFSLLGDSRFPEALGPLRLWLEENLEIAVRIDDQVVETLPVSFGEARTLREFCVGAIEIIQLDRSYDCPLVRLSFQYKDAA